MLCKRSDRKVKSIVSGVWVCGQCSVEVAYNKFVTIDEFIENKHPLVRQKWAEINADGQDSAPFLADVAEKA